MDNLISRNDLYEKTAEWEAQALNEVKCHMYDEDKTIWKEWSAILRERTAFKHDVADAPSVQPEHEWTPCDNGLPEEDRWYLCTLKDRRVNTLYWDNRNQRWIDNVRKNMFELYDIRSKLTGEGIKPNQESVYWDGWVVAWAELPKPYEGGHKA